MDLFFALGAVFFAFEIVFKSLDAFTLVKYYIRERDHDHQECIEQALINEIRKK